MDSYPIFLTPDGLFAVMTQGALGLLLILTIYLVSKLLAHGLSYIFTGIKSAIKTRKHEKRVWDAIFQNGEEIIAELDAEDDPFCGGIMPCMSNNQGYTCSCSYPSAEDCPTDIPEKEGIEFVDEYVQDFQRKLVEAYKTGKPVLLGAPSGIGKRSIHENQAIFWEDKAIHWETKAKERLDALDVSNQKRAKREEYILDLKEQIKELAK